MFVDAILFVACCLLMRSAAQVCPANKLLTFNAGLNPRVAKYGSREALVPEALATKTDVDVMCLQEIWYEYDMVAIMQALASSMPHTYSFIHHQPNVVRKPTTFSWLSLFGRLTTAPCVTSTMAPFGICALTNCRGEQGDDMLKCLIFKCKDQIQDVPQACITCLLISSKTIWSSLEKCADAMTHYNRLNDQGLVLLSKRPISNVVKKYYVPNTKQLLVRGYIAADVEGVGRVVCTHLTSNLHMAYFEWNLLLKGVTSWEEQQKNEVEVIMNDFANVDHILMGDLNTGPVITKSGPDAIVGEFPNNYARLLTRYTSLYETQDGRCTWCSYNALHLKPSQNKILDHILLKGHTGRNATRTLGKLNGSQLSDHFGETLHVCK